MPGGGGPRPAVRRDPRALLGVLALAALGWVVLVAGPSVALPGTAGAVASWLVLWVAMMTAMMLPSTAPLVLLYRRAGTLAATAALLAGYLAVWTATGAVAWLLHMVVTLPAAPVLLAAGAYQLTPVKHACLRRCRTPADFLVQRWRANPVLIGLDHGRWCLGCCWALMVVLVVVGAMGLGWVVLLAAVVAAEKLTAWGSTVARVTGVALLLAGIWQTWEGLT